MNDFDKSVLISRALSQKSMDDQATNAPLQSIIAQDWTTTVIFSTEASELGQENAWSRNMLISMRKMQEKIEKDPMWRKICHAEPKQGGKEDEVVCKKTSIKSPISLFPRPDRLESMSPTYINNILKDAVADPKIWKMYRPLFDNKVKQPSSPNGVPNVTYMRLMLTIAGPIGSSDVRYENLDDDKAAQKEIVTDFIIELDEMAEQQNLRDDIKRMAWGKPLYNVKFRETLEADVAYAVFSVLFVVIYIWFHLESLFLAVLSMLLILLSFPMTYFIYTGIFQIDMNTTLNQLTIFIVLGIAADDIFVFCDAWRQSGYIPMIANDMHRRLAYSFKRSFNAIIVTSSTTAIAFLANALSDIRPIRAFGIFAAIIIPVNFLIIITVMPPLQIIHDTYLKDRCEYKRVFAYICCRASGRSQQTPKDNNKTITAKKTTKVIDSTVNNSKDKSGSKSTIKPGSSDKRIIGDESAVTRCMSGPFNRIIIRFRYILVLCLFFLGIAGIIVASYIGPLTENQAMLPKDHHLMVKSTLSSQTFSASSSDKEAFMVSIVWGVKGLDRSDVGLWDPDDLGRLEWDESFTIAPAKNQ